MPRALAGIVNGRGREYSQTALAQNGDIPPSTIVRAQLVDKLQRPSSHLRQEQTTFRQLLREVLDTDDEPASSLHDSFETLSTNYKLIFVIVKVGLDFLLHDASFGAQEESVGQALDCLKAIHETIQRTPSILFREPVTSAARSLTDPPMFTWLIPKLLMIASLNDVPELAEACKDCIVRLVSIERKVTLKHVKPNTLRQFLHAYIKGLYICRFKKKTNPDVTRHLRAN